MIDVNLLRGRRALELRTGRDVEAPVPRHFHEELQICLITKGAGFVRHQGTCYPTPAGTLFAVIPGEVHENVCTSEGGCSFRTIFLDPGGFEIEELAGRAGLFVTRRDHVVRGFLSGFEDLAAGEAAEWQLWHIVTSLLPSTESAPSRDRPAGIEAARERLRESHADAVSLDVLAEEAGMSKFHFVRTFTSRYGMPPHLFQIQLRVMEAKRLLRQGHEIGDVAVRLGFADQSHFTRHFKRLTAVTPALYRSAQERSRLED